MSGRHLASTCSWIETIKTIDSYASTMPSPSSEIWVVYSCERLQQCLTFSLLASTIGKMTSLDDKEAAIMDSPASSSQQSTPTSTMLVDHRTNRSIPTFLLHHLIRPFGAKLISPGKTFPAGSPRLTAHNTAKRRCHIQERVVEGMYLYDLRPKKSANSDRGRNEKRKKRIYYFAGGGWQMPASSDHWVFCAAIANEVPNTTVTVVSYPLAPNSPAPVCFGALTKLYRKLLQDATEAGEEFLLAGDSAGGNIVLCLTLAALKEDESLPAPKAILVLSPSCDLSRDNPAIEELEQYDPILRVWFVKDSAAKWRGEWDAADPRVTPLHADVSLLARKGVHVHGVFGRYDILSPDVTLFQEKLEQAGVTGEWLIWEKQMHVFPLAWPYLLPESIAAKKWIIDLLKRS
ncbi:uncharacterized protein LTR77_009741 [Saxophila tyrrhenica]|uniref:Alpha/beta hydrolase fold-3 domain-containing protein n=1 Tax=Saxophila tyrrhenica TaxID=1690608 RepID=A0AAV9P101_9PEZI|nr:hypothetical protein LTR77_009741 [Saxophila tyrrhenica]